MILVVDDDEAIREFVSLALSDEGYTVEVAANGAAALKLAEHQRPSLILLDLQMPIMNGWEFLQRYRDLPRPHATIIVFTAATAAVRDAEHLEADGFLPKPFDLDDLLTVVARYAPPTAP